MVAILHNHGYCISNDDSVEDIFDLYDVIISKNNGIHGEMIIEKVLIPKEETEYLLTLMLVTTF
jgi:hypothetical protein